jgi:hypothetical protein
MGLKEVSPSSKSAIAPTTQPSGNPAQMSTIQKIAANARSVLSTDEITATVSVNSKRARSRAELAGATMITEYQGAMSEVMPVVATTLDEIDGFYFGAIYDAARVAYGLESVSEAQLPAANSIKSALPEGK